MSVQKNEKEKCAEFIEYIRYSIAIEPMSNDWDLKIEIGNNVMMFNIKSSKIFDIEETEFIVNTIDDYELFKFNDLRDLGWCSSSKIIESSPGCIEFAWLKIPQSNDLTIDKCPCQICLDRFEE